MKKLTTTFLLLTGAFASLVAGQTTTAPPTHTPPTPATIAQNQVNRLTKLLTLTSTQQTEALQYFLAAANANATVQTNLQTARQSLNTAVQTNNSAAITQAANSIGTYTAEATANNAMANAQLYLILTPTQQAVFTAFQGRGFGGFGGGGPGPRFRGRAQ